MFGSKDQKRRARRTASRGPHRTQAAKAPRGKPNDKTDDERHPPVPLPYHSFSYQNDRQNTRAYQPRNYCTLNEISQPVILALRIKLQAGRVPRKTTHPRPFSVKDWHSFCTFKLTKIITQHKKLTSPDPLFPSYWPSDPGVSQPAILALRTISRQAASPVKRRTRDRPQSKADTLFACSNW